MAMKRCILRPSDLLRSAIAIVVGAVCFCLLCLGMPLELQSASQKGNGPNREDQPVLRVSTRLVEVSVVVENRKGEPVRDLGRDDFTVLDDGREQQISVFSVESEQPPPAPARPLPANTFSNRLEYHPGTPTSVTVILLDGLNTHFDDQVYAVAQVVKFLKQIRPGHHLALYTLGSNLLVLHDFTSDAQSLVAALGRYTVRESGEVQASEPPKPPTSITLITPNTGGAPQGSAPSVPIEVGLEQYMRETAQRSADFYSMDRALRTLSALEAIAHRLSNVPGRKNLVWVASSFPFTIGFGTANAQNVTRGERSFGHEIERAERALNDANLAIYPVDARGLVSAFADEPNLSAERSVSARRPGENALNGVGQLTPTHDTVEELADGTGGRAFYGSNDILGSIRRAVEDARVTYTLAYYPSQTEWDGGFHQIKVKVRRSGARVLCRRGYFALAEKPLGPGDRDAVLREAALSPLESMALGVTVRVGADPSIPRVIDLTVDIDPRNVRLEQQSGRWVGSLDLLFAQLSAQGQILKGLSQPMTLRLTGEEFQQILHNGLSISGRLEAVAGAERLRVIARDATSGAMGSINIPLDPYVSAASRRAGSR